jgi:D-alanyl-lipoteichoic acid acyltransferase DltB (MBOAT superfamily)
VFYGWWRLENVPLIVASILFNYRLGGMLIRKPRRSLLAGGILVNVAALAYYKYTNFLIEAVGDVTGASWVVPNIVLPLAISFFTFQQIAYLVDSHQGAVTEHDFLHYCLFITFFPHLIAGPITHHREILPQFEDPDRFRPRWDLVAVGATLFVVGLFKKVMVADPFGAYATPVFEAARETPVQLVEAWGGALAYALQLYFDFSAYSDMATGLGLLFGVSLPLNFNSPYKARNMIEFWGRWHITLTRFLTAYIYNPIVTALTRRRMAKGLPIMSRGLMGPGAFVTLVVVPTVFTMFVSGVWHGAGWQFIIFGLLHGFYLVVVHAWRQYKKARGIPLDSNSKWRIAASVLLTFLCATVALVFFRVPDVPTAFNLLSGMTGLNGATLPSPLAILPFAQEVGGVLGFRFGLLELFDLNLAVRLVIFLFVVWALPNVYQWLGDYPTALTARARPSSEGGSATRWRPTMATGFAVGAFSAVTLLTAFSSAPTEFLYFQF